MDHESQVGQPIEAAKKKRGRGRPRTISDEERKQRGRERSRQYKETLVALSYSFSAWKTLRDKGHWNNAELAAHLLDVHSRFCKQPNCISSELPPDQSQAQSPTENVANERNDIHNHVERVEKSPQEIVPVPVQAANIVASYRPIRSKGEFQALGACGSVAGKPNMMILPKPVINQSQEASVTLGDVETKRGGVRSKNVTTMEKLQKLCETLEPEKKGSTADNGSNEECKATDPEWETEAGVTIILNEDGFSSEEDEGRTEKRQKIDHQVTDLPFQKFGINESRSKEVKALAVAGNVAAKQNVIILPQPVRNQSETSISESTAATVSIYTVVAPPEDKAETFKELPVDEPEEKNASNFGGDATSVSVNQVVAPVEVKREVSQEDDGEQQIQKLENVWKEGEFVGATQVKVEWENGSNVEELQKIGDNLEQVETGSSVGNDVVEEFHSNDPDWEPEQGTTITLDVDEYGDRNEDDDEDEHGYSSEEDEDLKKKHRYDRQIPGLPFRRFDVGEVARAEGVPGAGSSKIRLKKLYWTEMKRVYRCKICPFEDSNAYVTSRHLLEEHFEVVGDLANYLKERPAPHSETDCTLYDVVMEFSPSDDSADGTNEGSISCDEIGQEMGGQKMGEQEMEEQEIGKQVIGERGQEMGDQGQEMRSLEFPEEVSKTSESKTKDSRVTVKSIDPLDTEESVKLLKRWVKLQISCQFCQWMFNCSLYTRKGERAIHRCRSGKLNLALCDVCGKSFSYGTFRAHWTATHCESQHTVCEYCGKTVKMRTLPNHIIRCHMNRNDEFQCGICRKGFRTKKNRDVHEVIHRKEKPFKCSYCQRGFTQSYNMKNHMRQHTGEKPYQCDKCSECFAHNVSLKNHLKSKHGIDPWKTGSIGD